MNEWTSTPQFEENVRQSFRVPEIRSEFVDKVYGDLMQRAAAKSRKSLSFFGLRPAWTVALAILSLVIIGALVIGPQRVYAAVMQLFGYIPGVGIVDQSAPIRMLAGPVSLTRAGVTVSVNRATLTADRTQIDIGISGVPLSAYPKGEAVTGCIERDYLRLPDGTRLEVRAPIPASVNEATYILPCIFNTLPGTVPTGWELPLKFTPAPPGLTVMPVVDITPTALAVSNQSSPAPEVGKTAMPTPAQTVTVSVEKVIETGDGYILIGAVRPRLSGDLSIQITGVPVIRDANGNKVAYTFPQDINMYQALNLGMNDQPFCFQIKAAGVAFPLTIEMAGKLISPADPSGMAEVAFDAGSNPQPGQEWTLNQEIELAGHTLKLLSITADSRNGYGFRFETGKDIASLSVQIDGYTPVGGGGGGNTQGMINQSVSYAELPKGNLKIVFSHLMLASEIKFWQGQWSSQSVRSDWPAATAAAFRICLNADSFDRLLPLPAGLDGKIVFTQLNPQLQIMLAAMDGSQQQVIAEGSARAALSIDSSRLAYTTGEGIGIKNLLNGESKVIPGIFGRDLRWSPDGSRIANVAAGERYGIFVIGIDGKNSKQLSNLGYESIAGWSPDGSKLYYAIPGSSGDGFLLRSVDVNTGEPQDLFVLENSSRKAPLPAVSPDGKWIAYRASDNSSLYLKSMDGSPARLLLDNPANAINGIAWEKGSHLLGVSLITPQNQDCEIILIAPDSCETYRLPGLSGELDGVFIP